MLASYVLLIPLQLATARFLVSKPVLKVLYGKIGAISDLPIPSENASRRANGDDLEAEFTYGADEAMPDFRQFLDEVEDMHQWSTKLNSNDLDMKDFSDASKILGDLKKDLEDVIRNQSNETRRQEFHVNLPTEVNNLWQDPVKLREWYYAKLCLTYLIHIRFQVDSANRQKEASQMLSGYKVGYLFQKLMKLKTQMYRIMDQWNSMKTQRIIQHRPNWRTKTHSLKLLLALYERMLQLDVDVKDTVEMMKMAFWGREAFRKQVAQPVTKHLWK